MVAPLSGSKLSRTFAARRGLLHHWQALAAERRDRSRKLVWFHAPSVGEGLQARPIIDRLRARHPEIQIAYSFFSPSAEHFAGNLNVDMAGYLPFDSKGESDALLDILVPDVLAFVKLDVWPNLVAAATRRSIPTLLLSATVSPGSKRQGTLSALLLRNAYQSLQHVAAIDTDDALRLKQLGVRDSVLTVAGDTRFDQVWLRAEKLDRDNELLHSLRDATRKTIVAGSTWPTDERVLFAAYAAVKQQIPAVRLIIAPHEPTPTHLKSIQDWAHHHQFSYSLLSAGAATSSEVVIVDSIGVLGDLYSLADVAFVGGAFHSAGLHSVLEPASHAVPVVFGPRYTNSRDARLLLESDAAVSANSAAELATALLSWLQNQALCTLAGLRAVGVVESGVGAAETSVQLVLRALNAARASAY